MENATVLQHASCMVSTSAAYIALELSALGLPVSSWRGAKPEVSFLTSAPGSVQHTGVCEADTESGPSV